MKNKVFFAAAVMACATPVVAQQSPEAQAGSFFDQLKSATPEAAVAGLMRGSALASKTMELQAVTGQLNTVEQVYGAVRGYELIKTQAIGKDVRQLQYVLKYEKTATRWKFAFYQAPGGWSLVDFRFDDQAQTWFDD